MSGERHNSSQETALEEITDAELIALAIENRMVDVHVSLPAKVQSYDASTQTCTVTIMLNRYLPDGAGNFVSEPLPALSDVPVHFPTYGGFAVIGPVASGDEGMLVFSEMNMGTWRSTGSQSDPGDVGRFNLDGAWFIPGGARSDGKALQSASASNMVIGKDSNPNAQIVIKPTEIDLGAGAADGVASGTKNDSNLSALAAAIAGTPATVGPTEPLATAIKAAFATWFTSYVNTASTKIKTVL